MQKLSRRRALGNGPFGLVQAQFTPDEQCIVALFKLLIYDLAAVRANATRVLPLRVVQPKDVDSVYAEVSS
ncbi:hypothetical protein HaLaN_13239 [Haematococcus lacustris]|uniref:Uncharacterized protein n=1 Tax=Haematococcus lacustris TaxID=44745 RepID=A0A699Z2G9_HAELA|nr:hypothetical protein HaLaN_13239 [Haematococcus lacustris]